MSTRTGTLQAPRATRSIWPAAVIASLLMLSIGIGAFFLGRDQATPAPKTVVGGTEQTVVGGTAANTPTELSGGIRHKFVGAAPAIRLRREHAERAHRRDARALRRASAHLNRRSPNAPAVRDRGVLA